MNDLRDRLQQALGDGYTITGELGAGGMSRVFVAHDVALERDIVVKVLPPDITAAVNIERFRREMQLAARFQHPHIVPVLAAGAKDGLLYYTMPRIEGESLRGRLVRSGELPVGETIRLLRDIADALEYAHAHGVVHRDIKPENVLVSGHHALVTDFGVAKALSLATGEAELTSHGVALGTPSYMSPEQATADPTADHRTDIYALGVLGYELLSGRPPFSGLTQQQLLAAQVTEPPVPISTRRANVPPVLANLIMRCLEKKPADRIQTAEEVREHLEVAGASSGGTAASGARTAGKDRRQIAVVLGAVAAVILIGSLIASRYIGRSREEFEIGETQQVTNDPGVEVTPAVSPDGQLLAYSGGDPARMSVFVRQVKGGGGAIRLASGRAPQWSPDGSKIVYVDSAGIASVPALGGTPQRLERTRDALLRSPVWSHDGQRLAYSTSTAIWIANGDGSGGRQILQAGETHSISWSPDDMRLAFTAGNPGFVYGVQLFDNIAPSSLWIVGVDGNGASPLTDNIHHNVNAVWTADGDGILYVSNIHGGRDLYFQRIRNGKATGSPRRVTTGLRIHGISLSGGTLAYSVFNSSVGIWSMPIPRSGAASVASAHQITGAAERIEAVVVSPDGKSLAFDSDRSGNMDIYRMSVGGSGLQQLTRNPADEFLPAWSPDGKQITFQSWRSGNRDVYVMSADGSSERLLVGGPAHEWSGTWSPDGTQMAIFSNRGGKMDIWVVPVAGGEPRQLTFKGGAFTPRWSPDGKLIAFLGSDVRVEAGPGPAAAASLRVVSVATGEERILVPASVFGPVMFVGGWSADGRKIYFRVLRLDGSYDIAQVDADGSNPSLLVRFDRPDRPPYRSDFSTDGKTFYFTIGEHQADIWVMDLKKR
ncbi:MAG: serine/threonine-protein kinase [Gemmatimonadota bacterium]|nr:serine/threonine-protein kinase [Gemmatimonadota bacterium]